MLVVLPGDDGTANDDDCDDDFRGGDRVLDGVVGDGVDVGVVGGCDDGDGGPTNFLLLGVEGRAGD